MNVTDLKKYFSDCEDYNDINSDKFAEILSKAITFDTTSYEDISLMNDSAFKDLHKHIEESFPLVSKNMTKTVINDWTLLYHWQGSNSSLKPALFMAHLDVVPVTGSEDKWDYPPFSGEIAKGFVWGRGSIDTKGLVMGHLSAAEYLMEKGYIPERSIYLMFGHDEETMGTGGSLAAMEHLKKQGVLLEFVLDEGGGFKMGSNYGAPESLLAQVDIFEKGYADIAIEAEAQGGHSSRPGKGTSLGKVAKALVKIEENQMKPAVNEIVGNLFKTIAPFITEEPLKSIVAKGDDKALAEYLCEIPNMAPMVHTTTALTMINGSPAPNVLPQKVHARINFRIAPEDCCESVLNHCIETANDPELKIYMTKGLDPSKISKTDNENFEAIKNATNKFFPKAIVVPGLVTGGTDCRYFEDICDCCYRFRPFIDSMVLGQTAHAVNERSNIECMIQGIKVITEIMKTTCF